LSSGTVAIIGAGPYGLSLAAHLAARNVEHRIFGQPMSFWRRIADAGGERYLKSYCFGTNISNPMSGSSFADYSKPRGLETFEPCSMGDFAAYGLWFQKRNVTWLEQVEAEHISNVPNGFAIKLANGERFVAAKVVLATGLSCFAHVPSVLSSLPSALTTHTSMVTSFAPFKGMSVAVIGGGQSALEAAALLNEAGANPQLLVRKDGILWNTRVLQQRTLWQRLRSPISGLGTGPKAWTLTHIPGAMHRMPTTWRTRFVQRHLPPEGAWWLRKRVENRLPVHFGTTVLEASEKGGRVALRLCNAHDRKEHIVMFDHVMAGTGYDMDVSRVAYLDPKLRSAIANRNGAPRLNSKFETSVSGLQIIGPASAMSFGPLFRFVVGAKYTAQVVSAHLAQNS
jgi:cation diffusion facilitator CzcD-associated flavoprotein CzcO